MAFNQTPQNQGNPFYAATQTAAPAGSIAMFGLDRPFACMDMLRATGLRRNGVVTNVSFTDTFVDYLTWQLPAGIGPAGTPANATVMYTLATRTWSDVLRANSAVAGQWADTIIGGLGGSGVFVNDGDYTLAHADPRVTVTANTSWYIH
jgi:hypothetical protein